MHCRGQRLYFTEEGLQNINNHTYNGNNESILYDAVLKPLAVRFVEFVPRWVHPNAITLTGLFFPIISYILMSTYNPKMEDAVPTWLVLLCGINLFTYQTLDNMDGQQARRTGTSSALGQLFDHGCDAFNVTISSVTLTAALRMSASWSVIFILCAQLNFYIATWDEYHTKEMYLPMINGADEGLVITVAIYFATALILPTDFWVSKVYSLPVYAWFTIVSLLSTIATVSMFFDRVRSHSRRDGWALRNATWRLVPNFILSIQTTYWLLIVMPRTPEISIMKAYLTLGLCFGQFTTRLIVAHVCSMHFKAWQPALWVPMIPITCHLLAVNFGVILASPGFVMHLTLAIASTMWIHYAYICIVSISSVLGIRSFTIQQTSSNSSGRVVLPVT